MGSKTGPGSRAGAWLCLPVLGCSVDYSDSHRCGSTGACHSSWRQRQHEHTRTTTGLRSNPSRFPFQLMLWKGHKGSVTSSLWSLVDKHLLGNRFEAARWYFYTDKTMNEGLQTVAGTTLLNSGVKPNKATSVNEDAASKHKSIAVCVWRTTCTRPYIQSCTPAARLCSGRWKQKPTLPFRLHCHYPHPWTKARTAETVTARHFPLPLTRMPRNPFGLGRHDNHVAWTNIEQNEYFHLSNCWAEEK